MISEIAPGIFTVDHAVADGKNAIIFGPAAPGLWTPAPKPMKRRR